MSPTPPTNGISIVIPCLNEKETIERAVQLSLEGIHRSNRPGEVIVADNGSTDGSVELATKAGAKVISVPRKGYGAALDGGIRAANFEAVVFADADLSYPLEDSAILVSAFENRSLDLVLGSRLRGKIERGAMPFLNRHFGTPILSALIRWTYGLPTSDCNSGMRCFRRSRYTSLGLSCPGMEFASEMLVKAALAGWKYSEVGIDFRKDQRTRPPHLKRWRDGWRHLRFILGHAPSRGLIIFPALLGSLLLIVADALSFSISVRGREVIYFHTAFVAIAAAVPLLLFSSVNVVARFSFGEGRRGTGPLLDTLQNLSDRAVFFYCGVILYFLCGVEIFMMFYKWSKVGFGDLFAISNSIRLMVDSTAATLLIATDVAMNLVRINSNPS
ncbi:MAG: dolichol-P-glucose synthetase [Bdellovibrio sp.]|nr:MAG: dolichol-P-glucose synthetase [Bdellovibrio sp.]